MEDLRWPGHYMSFTSNTLAIYSTLEYTLKSQYLLIGSLLDQNLYP